MGARLRLQSAVPILSRMRPVLRGSLSDRARKETIWPRMNLAWPSATLGNENACGVLCWKIGGAGAGEPFCVVVVKAPMMNLVRPAWSAPWNELRLAEQLVNG
jgi:hypothetical protein